MNDADARQAMLKRIADALGRATDRPPTPPPVPDAVARLCPMEEDLPARFARQAEAMQMCVHRCGADAATAQVHKLLDAHGAQRVAAMAGLIDDGRLPGGCVPWTKPALFDADAAVTEAQYGIAETGTLVCCAGGAQPQGLSLYPPLHVAVLRAANVVADMVDLWPHLRGTWSSNIVLITGPSKTADIEGTLVTGMHGPAVVEIVLVEGNGRQ